jgi:hypothetical protein
LQSAGLGLSGGFGDDLGSDRNMAGFTRHRCPDLRCRGYFGRMVDLAAGRGLSLNRYQLRRKRPANEVAHCLGRIDALRVIGTIDRQGVGTKRLGLSSNSGISALLVLRRSDRTMRPSSALEAGTLVEESGLAVRVKMRDKNRGIGS